MIGGNSKVLDGATSAPLLLPIFRLISHGEFFCLFRAYETYLKLYPCTIVHPNLSCKCILLNFLFRHCLLMEGSQLLYIVLLIARLVLLSVECFGLQELFEGLGCLYLHQIEHFSPVCLEPKYGYSQHTKTNQ